MMNQSLEVNGYEFFFESTELDPPIGGRIKYEVKVIRIYDRQEGNKRLYDTLDEGRFLYNRKTENEAFAASSAAAREWAEAQR